MRSMAAHDVPGSELGGLAVVHLDVETTLQHQLKVVDLARRGALDRLQGCRPAKVGLEDAATEGQGPYPHQRDGPPGESAQLVRLVEGPLLDGAAGSQGLLGHD